MTVFILAMKLNLILTFLKFPPFDKVAIGGEAILLAPLVYVALQGIKQKYTNLKGWQKLLLNLALSIAGVLTTQGITQQTIFSIATLNLIIVTFIGAAGLKTVVNNSTPTTGTIGQLTK